MTSIPAAGRPGARLHPELDVDPPADPSLDRLALDFAAIFEATPSALRVFDVDGRMTRLNAAARAEHPEGRAPESLVALWESDAPLRTGLPAGNARDVRVLFQEHPASRALQGEVVRAETYVVRRGRADGDRRVVETYARPVRDDDGRIIGAVLVDRDATERTRLARALEEQVRRTMELNERVLNEAAALERMVEARSRELLALQEARARERRLAAVGQLAAGVMHDVNNALNPIMAAAYLLQRRAGEPAAVRDYAERIAKAAETCAASAARVGRFIRQEPPAEGRDVGLDLSTIADEVLALSRAQWVDGLQGVAIALDTQLGHAVTARGLPGEIREALLNLVQNAVDAMPAGGRLTVATGRDTAVDGAVEAWVEVRDTGLGMTDDVRDRAFEPFFTTKGAAGSGLGLAEVWGIMKRHRGRAEIRSAPGQGTTVRLVLPWAAPGAAPRTGVASTAPREPRRLLRRVLLVEDNVEGRDFLRALLAHDGHLVDAAADAREARALLDVARAHPEPLPPAALTGTGEHAAQRHARERLAAEPLDGAGMPYDVLISDIGLPDGNGWDLVREARQRWPRLRIVVVTGWEPPLRAEASMADLVLRKPLRADELLQFVAQQGAAPPEAPPAAAPAEPGRPAAP